MTHPQPMPCAQYATKSRGFHQEANYFIPIAVPSDPPTRQLLRRSACVCVHTYTTQNRALWHLLALWTLPGTCSVREWLFYSWCFTEQRRLKPSSLCFWRPLRVGISTWPTPEAGKVDLAAEPQRAAQAKLWPGSGCLFVRWGKLCHDARQLQHKIHTE